jgi:hypothetical protein
MAAAAGVTLYFLVAIAFHIRATTLTTCPGRS